MPKVTVLVNEFLYADVCRCLSRQTIQNFNVVKIRDHQKTIPRTEISGEYVIVLNSYNLPRDFLQNIITCLKSTNKDRVTIDGKTLVRV